MTAESLSSSVAPPLRILHIFARLNHGGAEIRTLELVRYLRTRHPELPLETHFCCLSGLPGTLDEVARGLGCQVHLLPLRGPSFIARFLKLLRDGRYDVVHSHVHHPSGLITLLAKTAGVPCRVVHFRSIDDGRPPGFARRMLVRLWKHLIDRSATHILGVSRCALQASWCPDWTGDNRCQVIYNGIDLGRFPDPMDRVTRERLFEQFELPSDMRVLVHVGRETPAKNHKRLLSIFSELKKSLPQAVLLLVGDLAQNSSLLGEVRQHGVEGSVRFLGRRDDVPSILAAADLMVFPSLWEGMPGAVLESLAAGTPVVASDILPHREIAEQLPGSIWLVQLEQSDKTWAERIMQVPQPTPATRLAARSAFLAGPFSLQRAAEQLLNIWCSARADKNLSRVELGSHGKTATEQRRAA